MIVPERWWVFDLIALKAMPEHILHHSLMVRRVAVTVACYLSGKLPIDIDLIDRGALLHDICKVDTIRAGGDHAIMGQRLLEILGFPHLGQIVGQHVYLRTPTLTEAMLVNYADKRVMHTRVVSISRRFVDLIERYGKDKARRDRILKHFAVTLKIERLISEASTLDPIWLNGLNLIPADDALYRRHSLRGQHGTAEQEDEDVDAEGVYQHEPPLIGK